MDRNYRELFDRPVDRMGTNSVKWDNAKKVFGRDVLPMWVADMDFATAPEIIEALEARVSHGIFGYTYVSEEDKMAVVNWEKRRHHTDIEPDWVLESPGVVDSLFFVLKALFDEGDGIVIQPPVYGPFAGSCKRAGLCAMEAPLVNTEAGWKMDLGAVEDCLKKGAKGMILCSPHNPVGRVWTRGELTALVSLLNRYGAKLVCDEIHADFELPGAVHEPILSIEGAEKAVMLISATKTFNLAAMRHSSIIAGDENIRNAIRARMTDFYVTGPSVLSIVAQRAAYEKGGAWLDALNGYLGGNRDLAEAFFREADGVSVRHLEGSYLMFVDFRVLNIDQDTLADRLVRAGVGLNKGTDFGEAGRGFMRLNLATTRANVTEGLDRIMKAVKNV